jgi:probable HAF family extracellular repeat protein
MRGIATVLGAAILMGCGAETPLVPSRQVSTAGRDLHPMPPRYSIEVLPSLGGTSRGNGISDHGLTAGYSNLPDGVTRHAVSWSGAAITDLGTLGGPNSSVVWPGLTNAGTIVGIAEMAAIDPLGESWSCAAFFPSVTHHVCRGFVDANGAMRPLPTLGGTHGFAAGINSEGQIVGWSETTVHDPTCSAPQVLQFRATLWDPGTLTPTELPPLEGDSTSAATAINARGQVVGISGDCGVAVGAFSARHAVLWDHGSITDLGNFGGEAWNTPMAINSAGDVVGFSDLSGDSDGNSREHAFLWTRADGIRDLGTLPGDLTSEASGINARRQIVGLSCGAIACRAVLWQNGAIFPLDSLANTAKGDQLQTAQDINDAGQITGRIIQASTGRRLAFRATPITDGIKR